METTFYDDNFTVKKMKTSMKLDFNEIKNNKDVLNFSTPDLGLFILKTPELEMFISNQSNMILTTPTPTSQILFPKYVTEEQEAYARGFIDALSNLQKNNPFVPTCSEIDQTLTISPTNSAYSQPVTFHQLQSINNNSSLDSNDQVSKDLNIDMGNNLKEYSSHIYQQSPFDKISTENISNQYPVNYPLIKNETSQIVPRSPPDSSKLQPINMDDQEFVKLERKRARNRLAATKCRNRKLERISRLEEKVKDLKDQNLTLAKTATSLRDQVSELKQTIIEHTQQGCQVMLVQNVY